MKPHWTACPSVPLLMVLCLALGLSPWRQAWPARAGEPSAGPGVERLIADLGSNDFKAREAAMRALREMDEVVLALRQALDSPDAEIRRRAAALVEDIEQRQARRGLARAQALAKEGRIMEAVERVVAFAKRDPEGMGGQALTQFADKVLELKEGEPIRKLRVYRENLFPAGDFRRYIQRKRLKALVGGKIVCEQADILRTGTSIFARAEEISLDPDGFSTSLLAASGEVYARGPVGPPLRGGSLRYCVILAGGSVSVDSATSTIVVSDGDVEVRGGAGGCLIFARGDVQVRGGALGSLLVARGKVTGKCMSCTIRAEDYLQDPDDGKKVILKEGDPDRFAFIKFFELSEVGLKVTDRDGQGEAVRDGVWLKEVRKGTLFSSALQAGDIVTAIDGTKAASQEVFRRLLRKRLAQGGPRITFTVRRAGQTAEVAVPVKD
jgi:hypothetical protein